MMFRFAYPVVLLLLLVVGGWLVFALWKKPSAITYSMTSKMAGLAGRGNWMVARLPVILRGCALVLLILAAARPQLYNVSRDIRSPGVDIMLCLDTSGSMQALDFKLGGDPVSRLTAVKKVVSDFIKKRESDRIGMVVFGEEAFTQSPLTIDKGLLLGLVEKMEIGMAGDRTAIGSAIAIGGKRLKDLKAKSKTLILLTDGRHNAGEITPLAAAEAVRALGVKIYTIGVGGKGPAPFRVKTFLGTRLVHQRVDLDEETLKKVAETGGGKYFRAADSRELSEIYDVIDRMEKTEVKVKEFFHFKELYYYFLVPALILFGLEVLLKTWILRVIP
ncbi:MAG: VWA domain-containing protein [Pseudomonadota bacterium]|nr:VWA domain-containing protein [Pseudomonadota bacterium]MBU0990655.1 VWA domain-containing protein [Pseudomonadota bacterium]